MRVIFVAKHGCGGNQDEDAVAYSLRSLGHEVVCVGEEQGWRALNHLPADLVLSFKWGDTNTLKKLKGKCIRAFWYFDLVDYPDPKLKARCDSRITWMSRVMPHVELGFCTDGDWALKYPDKLVWLTQGFDERQWEYQPVPVEKDIDLLFTGIYNGGTEREQWVDEMKRVYGSRFHHVQKGVHGKEMADLVNRSKLVLAPAGPVTDRYWSNRAINVLGYGGHLLHPKCRGLQNLFTVNEMSFYSLPDMHLTVEHWLGTTVTKNAVDQVREVHTYTHRCEGLIRIVKERL